MAGQDLSERIEALEVRLAYQDETIETLNQTVTAQWKQIDALTRQLAALSERLEHAALVGGDGSGARRGAADLVQHRHPGWGRRERHQRAGEAHAAVQLQRNLFEIQNDVCCIFNNTRY